MIAWRKKIYDPRFRSAILQSLVLFGVAAFAWVVVQNTATNLHRQGIASGFNFLDKTAGFDIIQHLISYDETSTYGRAFLVALLNTMLVSALGVLAATILGFILGIARLSHNWLVSRLALVYVETVRNIPLLLQLFFWYFAVLRSLPSARESLSLGDMIFINIRGLYLPAPVWEQGASQLGWVLLGLLVVCAALIFGERRRRVKTGKSFPAVQLALTIGLLGFIAAYWGFDRPVSWQFPELRGFNFQGGLVLLPELVSLLLALSIYTAAFIGEIVRAGILAVNRGQAEAAAALGLTRMQTLRLVVVPQAMRVIVPPMTSQYLNLTKNSSLAAAIAYPDVVLVFAGTVLMQTGQAVEVVAMTMAVYLALSLMISLAMNLYNQRIAHEEG